MAYDKEKIKKTALIIFIIIYSGTVLFWLIDRYHFTPKNWANSSPNERQRLITSLELQHKLVGMSKEQILFLLGVPDYDSILEGGGGLITYEIGKENLDLGDWLIGMVFFGVMRDYIYYDIVFDENDICISTRVFNPP